MGTAIARGTITEMGEFALGRYAVPDRPRVSPCPPSRIRVALLAGGLSLLGACATGPVQVARPGEEAIRGWDLISEVAILASPEMGGRAAGSPGAARAAEQIASEFRKAGLQPGGEGGQYLQPFELVTKIQLRNGNRLAVSEIGRAHV